MTDARRAPRWCTLGLVLVIALGWAPTFSFDLDSLLVTSVGGPAALEKLRTVTSYRIEGEMSLNAMPGRFVMYYAVPDLFRLEITFRQFTIIQAYDGTTAWQQDINGRVSAMGGFEKKELLKQIYLQSFAYLFDGRVPGSVTYIGDTTIDGRKYHEVVMLPLNDDSVRVYFDAVTGLQALSVSKMDNIVMTTTTEDYRWIDSVLLPYYSKATAVGVPIESEFRMQSVAFDVPTDSSLFISELFAPADFHFPVGIAKVEVPIAYRRGHLYLKASINGKRTASFLLDSGASGNFFNEPTVADLELAEIGSLPARGVAGFDSVVLVRTDSLQIGEVSLYNQVAGRFDMTELISAGFDVGDTSVPFGGVLGHDFLSRFPMLVDFGRHTLTVYNPDTFEPPPGGSEVPFYLTQGVPTVHGRIVGVSGDFLVDLGNAAGLILHPRFVEDNKIETKLDDIRTSRDQIGGVGGSLGARTAFAADFALGDILIQSLRVILPEGKDGLTGSEQLAGNIGNLVLEGFSVLFDYTNSRLIFYPGEQ
jgi:hypothetical protein